MAEKERAMMPQSTAGLVRYFDVEQGIKVKPTTVVAMSVGFAFFVLVLKFVA